MMRFKYALLISSISLLLGLPGSASASQPPFFPPYGVDLAGRDLSIKPGDDFYAYANGGWLARTTIPSDQPQVSLSREQAALVQTRLHRFIQETSAHVPRQPVETDQKIGAMYSAFMDERHVDALGVTPIRKSINAVAKAKTRTEIAALMGNTTHDFGAATFSATVDIDLKNPSHYTTILSQSGLGMPDRDYYLSPDFRMQRVGYKAYIASLLTLIGWRDPQGESEAILAMETRIAKASWTKVEQRDLEKTYNPMTPMELAAFAPGFPWEPYLASAGLGDKARFIVSERTAFPAIAEVYATTSIQTLKAALAFSIADSAAKYLSKPFQKARFEFRDHILSGQPKMQVRWKRAVAAVSGGDCATNPEDCFGTLNWAVGDLYTRHDFTPASKAKTQEIVAEVLAAYRARIAKLDWMSAATRREALSKLDTYTLKVGYPDHPRDYSSVVIRNDDLIGDVRRLARADWDFHVRRGSGAVDRSEWIMTPQTIDAYNGNLRDIVFPAAILQPPTFDPNADDAVNYGNIGMIIGHELTHGFDDQGRAVDAAGALRDWWAPADAAAFERRAASLGAQYARFQPAPGMTINPELTMGENIADLGGVMIALDAYHHSLGGKPAPFIDGTTGDQRFFMAFAQGFRGKATQEFIRKQTASDPHSWRPFRVNGPLANVDAWYAAFGVKPGDKLYRAPEERTRIW